MTTTIRCLFLAWLSLGATIGHGGALGKEFFGLHIHRADQGTAWPNVQFGSWRLWDAYVSWPQLEPERGHWDFTRLDRYVAMASLTNVELVLPLGQTPRWASARPNERSAYRPGYASEPADIEDWRNYVRRVGQRYKGKIRNFEIWNEPSDKHHYTGSVGTLVTLTCEAHAILKSIDPAIRVVSPASAGGGRHVEYLDAFLEQGGRDCIDVVGHHLYVFRHGPEAMVPIIRQIRSVMERNGVGMLPLWNTETGWWQTNADGAVEHPMVSNGGWRPYSGDNAVQLPLRAFLLARAEGIDRFFWYAWDNGVGLGMIETATKREKSIVQGWRLAVERLLGASKVECSEVMGEWECVVQRPGGAVSSYRWRAD